MKNKIIFIAYTLKHGGAGIAANKFMKLLTDGDVYFTSSYVTQDGAGKYQFFKRLISYFLNKLQFTSNPVKHSLNIFSYKAVLDSFKKNKKSIHHLHWVNNDTLSVFCFDKIPSGSIVTLHDEWLYCGSEHCYDIYDSTFDFESGYVFLKKNLIGINWNYIIWKVKLIKLSGRKDLIFTGPSTWICERAKKSMILKGLDVRVLPNPIDTNVFFRRNYELVNELITELNISPSDFVFVFSAMGGKRNKLKGFYLLEQALMEVQALISTELASTIKLVSFGGRAVENSILHGFDMFSLGHITSADKLALVYSCASCVIMPSLIESFGQVAAEASSCETPVICFSTSGLLDVIKNHETGLHAECYSANSLANKMIEMILMSKKERIKMGKEGREHILNNFSCSIVKDKYFNILRDAENLK